MPAAAVEKGRGRLAVEPREVEEKRQDHRSREVSKPADDPDLRGICQRDRLLHDAEAHDHGVAGEELGAGDNDQGEGDAEGDAHGGLGGRRAGKLSADHVDEDIAESDVGTCQHRKDEIANRVLREHRSLSCCRLGSGGHLCCVHARLLSDRRF